jgi:hypothetical protein
MGSYCSKNVWPHIVLKKVWPHTPLVYFFCMTWYVYIHFIRRKDSMHGPFFFVMRACMDSRMFISMCTCWHTEYILASPVDTHACVLVHHTYSTQPHRCLPTTNYAYLLVYEKTYAYIYSTREKRAYSKIINILRNNLSSAGRHTLIRRMYLYNIGCSKYSIYNK